MPDPALTDDIIEAAARGMVAKFGLDAWEDMTEDERALWTVDAAAAVAAVVPLLRAHIEERRLTVLERLITEQQLTEGDLTVAVAEAQRARAESATNRETGGAWRDRALTAEARCQAVERIRCWTNEDGKRFVFVDDLLVALGLTQGEMSDVD
jgi:hypothetical protein